MREPPYVASKPIGNSHYFECYNWNYAYEYAKWFLNGRESISLKGRTKLGTNCTLAFDAHSESPSIAIYYHHVAIVRYYATNDIVIRNGGWFTKTTKARINHFSPAYVVQKNYNWFVYAEGIYTRFYNNMLIDSEGRPYVYESTTN